MSSPWLIVCAVISLAALTHNMAGYSLLDPDEGRNAEVAREMAATGDYVLPHLNGLPYLDKPTLFFAVGALSQKVFGPNAFAARLPSLLFTLASIALVAWFARRIFGPGAGWTAAIATASTPFTLAYARIVIFDSALTFFAVLALVSFYIAVVEGGTAVRRYGGRQSADAPSAPGAEAARGWTALAWVAIAFGVLTKGPIAIVLPLLVAVPFALRYRAWRALADGVSLLLFCAIVVPWVVAVSLRVPGFLEYALITETAGRFSTDELGRTGPIWYFLAIFPAAALPWSLVLAGSGRACLDLREEDGKLDRRVLFLLLWMVVPVVFFTFSQSKRPQYVLPIVPAVALLVTACWHRRSRQLPGARWGAAGLCALGLFFIGASRIIPGIVPANETVADAIPGTAVMLGAACIGAGVIAWFAAQRRELLLLALSLPVAAVPVSSRELMREIGNDRSASVLASAIEQTSGSSVRVVGVGVYPPSLPFYLRRHMIVATADGTELTSNYLARHVSEYRGFGTTLRRADWWQEALLSCPEPTVFVVSADDEETADALGHLSLIAATRKYAVYGPCGQETLARTEQ